MKRHMTLTQLERDDWGPPPYDSFLVTECHRLRHVPLRDFTVENLRILIGQHISLAYTVPLALEHLSKDPMVSGDMYLAICSRQFKALKMISGCSTPR